MKKVFVNIYAFETNDKLYLNDELADVHFVFNHNGKQQKVAANKAILALLSSVFKTMFYGSIKEEGDVEIVDAYAEVFKEFLKFFYSSNIELSMKHMKGIAILADKYDIECDILRLCESFLKETIELNDVCWYYQFAIYLKHSQIYKCEKQIKEAPQEIFASNTFLHVDQETLKQILDLNFHCKEIDILRACLDWAKNACKNNNLDENQAANLRLQLGDCLKLINFAGIEICELTAVTALYDGLFSAEEFKDIVHLITVKEFEPKSFSPYLRNYTWNDKTYWFYPYNKDDDATEFKGITTDYREDVVSISLNKPLLLGYITTIKIVPESTGGEIIISQREKSDTDDIWKIISTMDLVGELEEVKLRQPILLKPNITYEFRLEIKGKVTLKARKYLKRNPVNSGVTMRAERHEKHKIDNVNFGLIAELALSHLK